MSNGMISCVQGAHGVEQSHCTHLKYSGEWKVDGLWSVLTQGVSPRLGLTPLVVLWISGLLLAFSSTASATVRVSSTENNLRLPGHYYDRETSPRFNYFRDYGPTTGRYVQADPIGLEGGMNIYGYANQNPLTYTDLLGLKTGVTIWQPVGWGESSFGHVSVDINGTTYSFGPKGMAVMPTADYVSKNSFRDGQAVILNLTPQQEALLKACLSKPQGKYNAATNNCGSPLQNCLQDAGIETGNQTLPVSLGNKLLDMGIVNGAQSYPASRPSNGWSAPWAR